MTSPQTTALRNVATGQVTTAPKNIMQLLGEEKTRKQIAALAGKYMTGERMLALCVNAIRKTPKLGQCDPQSVLGAMMAAAGLGLEPNTPTGHAYLIPYDKRGKLPSGQWGVVSTECQFQIGYKGFISLAYRSPSVESIEAEAVHENDTFEHMQGSKNFLTFKKALKDRGEMIGAYCLVKLHNGAEVAVTLPIDEIHKARAKSETYLALARNVTGAQNDKDRAYAQKKLDDTPWVMWEDDMAAKTAIKKLISKRLSLTSDDPVSVAMQLDDRSIDLSTMANPEVAREVFQEGMEPPTLEEQYGDYVPPDMRAAGSQVEGEATAARTAQASEAVAAQGVQEPHKTAGDAGGAPAVTFEQVMAKLKAAPDYDMLCAEADLIQHVAEGDRREQLSAIFKKRSDEFKNPGQAEKPAQSRRRAPTTGGME